MTGPGTTLVTRLRASVLLLAVVLALVVGLAAVLLAQVRDAQDRALGDYFSAYSVSTELFTRLLEVEGAASVVVMTGDEAARGRLQALLAPDAGAPTGDDLVRFLRHDPDAREALGEARQSARDWLAGTLPLVEQVAATGPAPATTAALAEQRAAFAEVRDHYETYLDAVLAGRQEATEDLARRTDLLFLSVLLAAATAVGAAVALHLLLRRWVTTPVLALAREARAVRQGQLDHVVAVSGPPEIAGLGEDVDRMRSALVAQLGDAQAARRDVEQARELLERQAEDLRRSNRDLEQFAYVASHDLQEPLRKVASFCQMLDRRYTGQLDDRADQYIAFAVDGAKRMQQLINDLLAFSRVGRSGAPVTDVALDDVLAQARRNLASALEESGATVTADPLPVVPGERGLLVQLLQNLLGNAVKFRGDAPPRVHLSARRDGDWWQLACSDNGIGIEPQYAERIFVIFQRLHPKAEYEGTGIGLALCKKIVEHHGGQLWLDPSGGPGATFRWTLPVTAPERPGDELAVPAAPGGTA